MNIIGKARKSAFTRSAENVLKAGKLFYASEELDEVSGEIRFECKNNVCTTEDGTKLDIDGNIGDGYIFIDSSGNIEFQLEEGEKCATKYINKNQIFVYDSKCDEIEIVNDYNNPVIDTVNYNKTTKSITIVVNAHADSGISKYEYSIDGGNTWSEKQDNNTYTFDNLTNDKEYEIKVRIYNGTYGKDNYDEKVGRTESDVTKVTLDNLPLPIINVVNETTYEKSKQINIDYGNIEGTTGTYSIDGGTTWIEEKSLTIDKNNTNIIAKTTDGTNTVTITHLVTHIDTVLPSNVTLNINNDTTYSKTKSITVTLKDSGVSGLVAGSIKYGWSTSNTVEPTSYITVNTSETTGENATTFTASGSNLTGEYYLWVAPVNYKDKAGNINNQTITSTGTFKFDNTVPTLTLTVPNGTTASTSKTATVTISDNIGLKNEAIKIYYAWGTSSLSCSSMTNYITITPTSGAKSATGTITIQNSSNYGNGKLYICNKDMAINDIVGNKINSNTVRSSNMYLQAPLSVSLTDTGIEYNSIAVRANATTGSGLTITKYEFKIDSGSYTNNNKTATKTFSGLNPRTNHTIYVRVTDSAGNTATSSINKTTMNRCEDEDCWWEEEEDCSDCTEELDTECAESCLQDWAACTGDDCGGATDCRDSCMVETCSCHTNRWEECSTSYYSC